MISVVKTLADPKKLASNALCRRLKNKFMIHKHEAIRAGLHYDLRIEHDCVLKSWATRKLPDLVSSQVNKIMLFQTPDHSLDWFDFEGEITDEYGKGKVSMWDVGDIDILKWDNNIIINFKGKKLNGVFAIIPMSKEGHYLMLKSKKGE